MRFPSYAHNYGWLRWAGGQNTPANEHDLAKFMCAVGQHYLNVKSQREQQKQTGTKVRVFLAIRNYIYMLVFRTNSTSCRYRHGILLPPVEAFETG